MKEVKVMGIDLAKSIFQVHGVDEFGKVIVRKQIKRKDLVPFFAQLKPCLIGMESCGGSNHWARVFQGLGHEVKLMAPQFVKPYRKAEKNDKNDAEAICEAVQRPNMRFVTPKSVVQQDIQSLHRIRTRFIRNRTALTNQTRGLLLEIGIAVPRSLNYLRKQIPILLESEEVTSIMKEILRKTQEELNYWDLKLKEVNAQLDIFFKNNDACQRISEIEGVGVISATAVVSSIGNAKNFKNGREFAAFLGLVPRQNSSGGKNKLLGISKRGDKYLRGLLIHGARSVVFAAVNKRDPKSEWINKIRTLRGANIASVAVANKNARQLWAVIAKNEVYRKAA